MSTILSADDLNDFIAPGVACIKPVEINKTSDSAEIQIGVDGEPVEVSIDRAESKLEPAKISLTDCLACSGCITSAEAVLVELQSPKELFKVLNDSEKIFVASICPQTRASLAQACELSVANIDAKLRHLFAEKLGFKYIVGTEIGRAMALVQEADDAWKRKDQESGPVLSSICPGWTCYVEKSHPEMLPFLSHVRSPQQITGHLVKELVAKLHGTKTCHVYHVSIMPCFDKKLEAARPDFEVGGAREVDLVITAREVVEMINTEFGLGFDILPNSSLIAAQVTPEGWPVEEQWLSNAGSSSGGYLAYTLAKIQSLHPGSEIVTIPGKNNDQIEYHVVLNDQPVFRGAQVYGFRNIQNLVRKLKPSKGKVVRARASKSDPSQWNYVELMACPGGCINGGGQLASPENVPSRLFVDQMEHVYRQIPLSAVSEEIAQGYLQSIGAEPTSDLLFTTYKPLVRDNNIPEALAVGTQW